MSNLFGEFGPGLVLVMVLALVQLLKKFSISGNWLILASVAVGFVFGALYELTQVYPVIAPYVRVVIYGLLMGLTASGLYDLGMAGLDKLNPRY